MITNSSSTKPSFVNWRIFLFLCLLLGSYIVSYLFVFIPLLAPPVLFSIIIAFAALPSLYFLYRWIGLKGSLAIIPLLCGLTILIEGFGIVTGFPYGHFYYTDVLGFRLFGLVPWTVPFAFLPLLIGSFVIASQLVRTPWKLVLLSAVLLVMVDLVLDPALLLLNIWVWVTPGIYYGVPVTNYLGWFFTGLLTSTLLLLLLPKRRDVSSNIPPPLVSVSLVFTVSFWSGFTLWSMLWIPFFLSLALIAILFPIVGLDRHLYERSVPESPPLQSWEYVRRSSTPDYNRSLETAFLF